MNRLYCGDNLQVLRKDISADSVDLVYLDPPFNSPGKLQRSFQGALRRTIGGTN